MNENRRKTYNIIFGIFFAVLRTFELKLLANLVILYEYVIQILIKGGLLCSGKG